MRPYFLAIVCGLAIPLLAQQPPTSSDTAGIAKGLVRNCANGQWLVKDTTFSSGVRCVTTPTSGGANPAGSGSELQYRSDATTFGAVTGSSWDGTTLTLANSTQILWAPAQTKITAGAIYVDTVQGLDADPLGGIGIRVYVEGGNAQSDGMATPFAGGSVVLQTGAGVDDGQDGYYEFRSGTVGVRPAYMFNGPSFLSASRTAVIGNTGTTRNLHGLITSGNYMGDQAPNLAGVINDATVDQVFWIGLQANQGILDCDGGNGSMTHQFVVGGHNQLHCVADSVTKNVVIGHDNDLTDSSGVVIVGIGIAVSGVSDEVHLGNASGGETFLYGSPVRSPAAIDLAFQAANGVDDGMMTPANGQSITLTAGTGVNGGTDGSVISTGLTISGLTTPTNKPVCFDANGKLYAGSNTVGVLSCP